jgi:hypothetical protein
VIAAGTIKAALGAMAVIAIADDRPPERGLQDLLDQGFAVIAEGKLFEMFECDPEPAPITVEEIRRGYTCASGKSRYGDFKRLRGDNSEFVCVSFRNWACYQSTN